MIVFSRVKRVEKGGWPWETHNCCAGVLSGLKWSNKARNRGMVSNFKDRLSDLACIVQVETKKGHREGN